MLKREDDIGADAIALRRNIFAAPAGTSTRDIQSAHNVFDRTAGEGANRLTDRCDDPWAARAAAWLKHVLGVARLVLAAVVVGAVVGILAARGPDGAAPRAPERPPAQAAPTQGHRTRPVHEPTRAGRQARSRAARSKAERRRSEPSHARRPRAAPSPHVAAPSPPPAPVAPSATPQAPRPAEKPAPVPESSPPEFM